MFAQPHRRPKPSIAQNSDFLRLGLRHGESRSVVIRSAIQASAHRLAGNSRARGEQAVDRQLGLLTASAYRLLDPRYRTQSIERIQLSYPIDREENKSYSSLDCDLLTIPDSAIVIGREDIESEFLEVESAVEISTLDGARELIRFIRKAEASAAKRRQKRSLAKRFRQSIVGWFRNRAG